MKFTINKVYTHVRTNFRYECIGSDNGDPVFKELHNDPNLHEHWVFTARQAEKYAGDKIDWAWSVDGRWEDDNGEPIDYYNDGDDCYDEHDDRDEWDDYWADAAKSVGAVPSVFL